MIRLFRKLRLTFLQSNKRYKYLLYALGEILLVVVGILIALQVNNWNLHKQDHKLKTKYLQALKIDIESDIENLKNLDELNNSYAEWNRYFLDYLDHQLLRPDSNKLLNAIMYTNYKPSYAIKSSIYEDLVSSGNMKILEDFRFKKQLSDYYTADEWVLKYDDKMIDIFWYQYDEAIRAYMDPSASEDFYRNYTRSAIMDFDVSTYDIQWDGMKNDKGLKNSVKEIMAARVLIEVDQLKPNIQKAEALIQEITKQLEK